MTRFQIVASSVFLEEADFTISPVAEPVAAKSSADFTLFIIYERYEVAFIEWLTVESLASLIRVVRP